MLTAADADILLKIARDAINYAVKGQEYSPAPREEKKLNDKAGCFVTIKQNGQLRGCIGNFQSQLPLYREVAQMAVASATQDPRFPAMDESELDDFNLELTVLSPLKKIENLDEIEIGVHGLYIEKGFNRGVLLPQVATEHGWDRDLFLRHTCIKAGLNEMDWQQEKSDIYIFSGQIADDYE